MARVVLVSVLALVACGVPGAGPIAGDAAGDAAVDRPLPALPLAAHGRWIDDAHGNRFKLASVNWYGAEEQDHVLSGLDRADVHAIARWIREHGFNSVRLPWSNELVELDPPIADALVAANPSLAGLHALAVLDAVIDALAREGLVVILDNHVSRADWCCADSDRNGLWYTPAYPESAWLADWRALAARYANQPAVVGADLRNEPRSIIEPATCTTCTRCPCAPATGCTCTTAVWGGSDPATDWRGAATRAADAVLAANPRLLVIVEGTSYAGDLTGVYANPIDLGARRDRLVYAAHDYSFFHPDLMKLTSPTYQDLATPLGKAWGFVLTQGQRYTAPIWVSELGTCHGDASCLDGSRGQGWWFQSFRRYLGEADVDWSYWALNGTSARGSGHAVGMEEGYGLLDSTWTAPALPALVGELQQLQPATQGP